MSFPVTSCLSSLSCPECNQQFDPSQIQTFCNDCQSPLLAGYDLEAVQNNISKNSIQSRVEQGIWRWHELLPVRDSRHYTSLGEGNTPLLPVPHIAKSLALKDVSIKDESHNPTGTFKARGFAVAVSKARELGLTDLVVPTAGNAGGALAAYAARSGLTAHIYMPQGAPLSNRAEVRKTGAELTLVPGLISDAGQKANRDAAEHNWFSMATFREPYRVEGKKTLGYELALQGNWQLPDVILYPTGGGTGLVGMWKAFQEMEELGWIGSKRPRMVTVQAEGCAPIVKAMNEHASRTAHWENARTMADGLQVPDVFADRLVLRALRESGGTAVSVSDAEIEDGQLELGRMEGIFAAPEGAATLAALKTLRDSGWLSSREQIVLFNTGSGLKYIH